MTPGDFRGEWDEDSGSVPGVGPGRIRRDGLGSVHDAAARSWHDDHDVIDDEYHDVIDDEYDHQHDDNDDRSGDAVRHGAAAEPRDRVRPVA